MFSTILQEHNTVQYSKNPALTNKTQVRMAGANLEGSTNWPYYSTVQDSTDGTLHYIQYRVQYSTVQYRQDTTLHAIQYCTVQSGHTTLRTIQYSTDRTIHYIQCSTV